MITLENYEVMGWEHAIRGMRNPMNSWDRSDTVYYSGGAVDLPYDANGRMRDPVPGSIECGDIAIGPNDHELMMKLAKGGSVHAKYRRMITVYVDITAPLYWWKEFDTYKVGTVANSCSTMHKIHEKEFSLEDFSCEKLTNIRNNELWANISDNPTGSYHFSNFDLMKLIVSVLNDNRDRYNHAKEMDCADNAEEFWHQMIQLLPSSYNQKRTVMLNYEVLANIYASRKNHKLDEWNDMCEWIESLPYSEIVIGGKDEEINHAL